MRSGYEGETLGMGEEPRERIRRSSAHTPPWWAWVILSILLSEAAWFANTTVSLEATVAALSAKVDAVDQNVNRLMDAWSRRHGE